ncbi:HlyD family type I secretion membrane fusion protein [Azorhizobium sp. AG788]|uniref:HlyD family type I secretion periplasmic adaptor subunit n=1 Tax=Azorhizobium sp. AG788 TaxID=2183897 RepID=UPI0010D18518|nr:HlyD family type I secretion periplasmic adaptor subunit [Azorhizobium sp. AG788]TDT99124.1 HlyD family type I secretion membrane fusion protein [Azorhizobium sp. AG788]
MKSADAASGTLLPLPRRVDRPGPTEREFLPAALEIIETPASPVGRAIGATIIAFFVVAIAWSTFGKIDIIATAPGRIVPTGRTKSIQPFETGVVREIKVADGSVVKAGDVLVEIDPTANAADERRLIRDLAQDKLDIARLTALLSGDTAAFVPPAGVEVSLVALERREMEEQSTEHAAKLTALDRQIAQKEAEAEEAKATIEKGEAALPMLKGQFEIRDELVQKGFGTKLQYFQAQQQMVEQEHQILVDTHRRDEAEHALAALKHQRAETEAEYRKGLLSDLAKAQTQASEHEQDAVKAAQRRTLQTLTAPVDGTVQQLSIHTVGGVVTPAQTLMMLVPKDSRLEIEANLANRDVGFVHAGQDVEIKVETFTFTRYGLLHGTVESVSRDAVAPDNPAPNARQREADAPADETARQAQQPAYVAHIAIRETGLDTEEGFAQLEPGMAVTAEIKTGQRRVIEFLLSPLLRYRHDFGGER